VIYSLIGPYPPPLGGVSVYAYRLRRKLEAEGVRVRAIDPFKLNRLARMSRLACIAFNPTPSVFHLNALDLTTMIALSMRPFGGRIIYQDHSGRGVAALSGWKRAVLKLFLRRVDEVILVGGHLRRFYDDAGILLPEKTRVEHAFLPPPLDEEAAILAGYDEPTMSFVETRRPLVVANAFRIAFHQGADLYGMDMCIDLAERLRETYPDVGLLFALAEIGDHDYFARLEERIESLDMARSFHFMTGQKELWPLFRKADLMVRPTLQDGYGVSVAEAIYFGCPAIASNTGDRPEGAILFETGNFADFLDKAVAVLAAGNEERTR